MDAIALQSVLRYIRGVRFAGDIGGDVTQQRPIGEEQSQLPRLDQIAQHDGYLRLDENMGADLLLAHVDPHLALEIADAAVLREIIGIGPATERLQVHHPGRDAHHLVELVNHCNHGRVLSFRGRIALMITIERVLSRRR